MSAVPTTAKGAPAAAPVAAVPVNPAEQAAVPGTPPARQVVPPVDEAVLRREVQGLVLTTYRATHSRNLILKVVAREPARQFLAELLDRELLTFGPSERRDSGNACAINIGFTFAGLRALGAPLRLLDDLDGKSHAFGEGPTTRAADCLGDAGESAAERWDQPFAPEYAHVWIAVFGSEKKHIEAALRTLQTLPGAMAGLEGWLRPDAALDGAHLLDGRPGQESVRNVHFGLRDNLTKPTIRERQSRPDLTDRPPRSAPGELLLGYPNDAEADVWTGSVHTEAEIANFLRNGSFGVLRKIQQYEGRLAAFLEKQVVQQRQAGHGTVTAEYLKAKMCGRWPNGAPVLPNDTKAPPPPNASRLQLTDFKHDPFGEGCPFGSHIRRAHPRDDPLFPQRSRVLFRRGIPYGEKYEPSGTTPLTEQRVAQIDATERGLLGIFFCARIEDQFEQLISEWLEKNPPGPPNRGRAKDPLLGNHDEPGAEFHIPLKTGSPMVLRGFDPFVRTRGTLYAMFPSRTALAIMAYGMEWDLARGMPVPARPVNPVNPIAPGADGRAPLPPSGPNAGGNAHASSRPSGDKPPPVDLSPEGIARATMTAPQDRFCDVVMEGGITSGIIYASAVVELGRWYRFRNIGGSSIGAFGAALAAAAEYRRRAGHGDGFAGLAQLPDKLAEKKDKRTRLERLFKPERTTRRLFEIFLATLEKKNTLSLLRGGFLEALRQYRLLLACAVVCALLAVLVGPWLSLHSWTGVAQRAEFGCSTASFSVATCATGVALWAAALLAVVGAATLAALLAGFAYDITRGLVPNGFGLCRGWSETASLDDPDAIDLAGYLHTSIQQVAGRDPVNDEPLTFQDLWSAPGSPNEALHLRATGGAARSINLEMYSSNLAHGRPYRFPLDADETVDRLFFRAEELAAYFPAGIVQHLIRFSRPYTPIAPADPTRAQAGPGYLELPVDGLPIVVAVRMAMSFPFLISAVPLYAIDSERKKLSRCWMSDGGLCSNFPIHLFDSFIPQWPTFGIALYTREDKGQGKTKDAQRVWLPQTHAEGAGDEWDRRPVETPSPGGRLLAFLRAIWLTTWHWNDSTMMRMPGVRDRVVRVYLAPGEGGVNIRMAAEKIRKLGTVYGREAALEFVRKFAEPASPGWQEHRWVRFNTLLVALRERFNGFSAAAGMKHYTVPLAQQIAAAATAPPPLRGADKNTPAPSEALLDAGQISLLKTQLDALAEIAATFEKVDMAMGAKGATPPFHPVPKPNLRMRHPT